MYTKSPLFKRNYPILIIRWYHNSHLKGFTSSHLQNVIIVNYVHSLKLVELPGRLSSEKM